MSRLQGLTPEALKALFSPDSDDTLITLLTLTGSNLTETIRLADGYTQRISETDDDIEYGVISAGVTYRFLPFNIELPSEEDANLNCSITLNDVTRSLLPEIRKLTTAPNVQIDLVLASNPDYVEISLGDFYLGNISYAGDSISANLTVQSYENEPFPSGTFTPGYFQSMF